MKRYVLIMMMLWNLFFGNAAEPTDWANKSRYAQANRELLANGRQIHTVLMGNSITENWEEIHPRFFTENDIEGRGISGQVSSQMLVRFRQDVIDLNPQVVVINCGTNDIAENNGPYDEDITMDNIQSMTELAVNHGITVVLSSVLPCDGFIWNPKIKDASAKIQSLNRRIKDYAYFQGLYYIDYYPSMVSGNGALNPSFTQDGVHPNAAGYDVMERLLKDTLSIIMEPKREEQNIQ